MPQITRRSHAPRIVALCALIVSMNDSMELYGQSGDAIPLWENGAPGALGVKETDRPIIEPYLVGESSDATPAIVVCPGGGYGGLARHEGHGYAEWLNEQGVSAFVLRYRLGSAGYRHPIMLMDVSRAMRLVRAKASEFHVDPARIGVMGSSAGGHLASTLLTHFDAGDPDANDPIDRVSSRPDFGILCYAVISMGKFTHSGSKRNLLGEDPDPRDMWSLSNELQVTPDTPPCFIWSTEEDPAVPVENSLQFALALRKANVPFDLHVYQKGRHGIGLAKQGDQTHPWADDLIYWLKENEFIKD